MSSEHWPLTFETVAQLRSGGWSEDKIASEAQHRERRMLAEDYQARTGCTMLEAFRALDESA